MFKKLIILNLLDPHITAHKHTHMHSCYLKEKSDIYARNVINDRFLHTIGTAKLFKYIEND